MGVSQSTNANIGWRILEIMPDGPCSNKDICVYFEFIVGINGCRLDSSSELFWDIIQQHQNQECILTLFNYKTRIRRNIEVTPNANWNGDGLLGLVIVKADFTVTDEQCIRILKVNKNSPAERAGLIGKSDYLLGTPIEAFTSFSIFRETIEQFLDAILPIYVYNSELASLRLIEITPSSTYSNSSILGCDVGDGYLHHLPSLTDRQTQISFQPSSQYIISKKQQQQSSSDSVSASNSSSSQSQKSGNSNVNTSEQLISSSNNTSSDVDNVIVDDENKDNDSETGIGIGIATKCEQLLVEQPNTPQNV